MTSERTVPASPPWDATSHPVPHVLDDGAGGLIATVGEWRARRDALLASFGDFIYGRLAPDGSVRARVVRAEEPAPALGGAAERRQLRLEWSTASGSVTADLLLYLPARRRVTVPVFLGLNFGGNPSISLDAGVWLSESWHADEPGRGVIGHRATEASRGTAARRWPIEEIVARGYAVATCYYGDFDPDYDDGFANGAHALERAGIASPSRGGAIAAWSWGLSRLLDVLGTIPEIRADQVVCIGHSRLGKAALWAAASDERFAGTVSNDSGCGGAALTRRDVGESVASITTEFPHWFAPTFAGYAHRRAELPVDQHHLLALIAPRPLYVASASEDLWADPDGEYLSGVLATPAWELHGEHGLAAAPPPAPGVSIGDHVAYHRREGAHDILAEDWRHYLEFADRHLR